MLSSPQGPLEQKNELGILFKHAYSMTAVERVIFLEQKKEGLSEIKMSKLVLCEETAFLE